MPSLPPQCTRIFAGNVTYAGEKVAAFLQEEINSIHYVALSEMHLRGDELITFARRSERFGWNGYHSQATPTGRGGTSGGVSIFAAGHVQASATLADPYGAAPSQYGLQYKGLSAIIATAGNMQLFARRCLPRVRLRTARR